MEKVEIRLTFMMMNTMMDRLQNRINKVSFKYFVFLVPVQCIKNSQPFQLLADVTKRSKDAIHEGPNEDGDENIDTITL